jgi:hypothetical protein
MVMISIKWIHLLNPELAGVLNKIVRSPGPFSRSIKILAIIKGVESGQNLAKSALQLLREKYLELNEPKTMWVPVVGKESEAESATKDFERNVFEKDIPRIKYSEMGGLELSAHDLAILEPFLSNDIDKPDLKLAPEVEA